MQTSGVLKKATSQKVGSRIGEGTRYNNNCKVWGSDGEATAASRGIWSEQRTALAQQFGVERDGGELLKQEQQWTEQPAMLLDGVQAT